MVLMKLRLKALLPIFIGEFHKLARRWTAGVVDDHIDPAKMAGAVVDKFFNIIGLAHVRDDRQHFATGLLANRFRRFVERRLAARADRHLCAFARETQRRGLAHALARAGD